MAALLQYREERGGMGLDVSPPWLNVVRAERVLRHGTDRHVCQLLAGDHQAGQSGVHDVALSQFLRLCLDCDQRMTLEQRILVSVQKCGWKRSEWAVCSLLLCAVAHTFLLHRRR